MLKTILAVMAAAVLLSACEDAAKPAPQAAAPQVRNFLVFFDFDRSTLTPRAQAIVKEAAGVAKAGSNARVTCTGHTDTAGSNSYNMALSLRRANTVEDALVREGVPASSIAVVGRGEEMLLVQTRDGVREPQNRRVEIVIQ
jgi:outer membrane protein OmpA-like peptidoglycan-associated protein